MAATIKIFIITNLKNYCLSTIKLTSNYFIKFFPHINFISQISFLYSLMKEIGAGFFKCDSLKVTLTKIIKIVRKTNFKYDHNFILYYSGFIVIKLYGDYL